MRDSLAEAHEFHLAEWKVTPSQGLLQCRDVTRRVPPRLMRLLLVLVSRSPQVVTKQELFDRVWDNEDASDDSLSGSVYQLRKALGDEPTRPRYIETIPKRGYRMLVAAQFPRISSTAPAARPAPTVAPRTGSKSRDRTGSEGSRQSPGFANDAMAIFSRGQALLASHRLQNLLQAKLYFEHALALEARLAAAHASLACVHVALLYNQHAGPSSAEHARWNARAALEIDPSLGWAHAAQALVHGFVDWDFQAADAEYRVALELRPDLVVSRRRYALLLAAVQRDDDALYQLAEAKRYDPVNVSAEHEIAHIFFVLRRFDRAAGELLKVLSRESRSWTAYARLAFIHWLRGNATEVHATYRAAASACDSQALVERIDRSFASGGVAALYATIASHLESRDPEHRLHSPELIATYIAAGNHARALQLLEAGCAHGDPEVLWLFRSPYVDPLRSDAVFQSLAARYDTLGRAMRGASVSATSAHQG